MMSLNAVTPEPAPRPITTVRGPISHATMGITDAHNHEWIGLVPGAERGSPVLNQQDQILQELREYREAGGSTLLD